MPDAEIVVTVAALRIEHPAPRHVGLRHEVREERRNLKAVALRGRG